MSERLNKCPSCGALQFSDCVVKAHNPETTDLNMRVTLRCGGPVPDVVWKGQVFPSEDAEGCGHVWEGLVTSPNHEKQRERGWVI
jgi:uncharacterized Zn finger protein